MRYFVKLSGAEHQVDIERSPDGTTVARLGGRTVPLDVVSFGPREMSLRVGARVVDLTVEGQPPALGLIASGARTYVEVESERMRMAARAQRAEGATGERVAKSPMPGRVVKVLVAVGDEVPAGHAVAIVEAMKMENEVKVKQAGTVTAVHVAAGATVEANAPLVTLQ